MKPSKTNSAIYPRLCNHTFARYSPVSRLVDHVRDEVVADARVPVEHGEDGITRVVLGGDADVLRVPLAVPAVVIAAGDRRRVQRRSRRRRIRRRRLRFLGRRKALSEVGEFDSSLEKRIKATLKKSRLT